MTPRKRKRTGLLLRLLAGLDAKTIALLVTMAGAAGNCVSGGVVNASGEQNRVAGLAWTQSHEDRLTAIETERAAERAERDWLRWRVKKLETRLARLIGKPVLGGAVEPYGPPAPKGSIAASTGRAATAPLRWLGRLFAVKGG